MDLNLVVLAGTVATQPEVRTFTSGTTLIRYLLTVRTTEPRRRVDVVPVTLWEPRQEDLARVETASGHAAWVAGSIQRRFWSSADGRSSRVEVIAHEVRIGDDLVRGEEPPSV
jgi:single-stranded DNA-binding protein